jgi:hypothetical protein
MSRLRGAGRGFAAAPESMERWKIPDRLEERRAATGRERARGDGFAHAQGDTQGAR